MDQYFKKADKSYDPESPAARRRRASKPLKQTRLPPNTAASPGSLKRKPAQQAPSQKLGNFFHIVSDRESDSESSQERPADAEPEAKGKRPRNRKEKEGEAGLLNGVEESMHKRRKKMHQSRIGFEPGGNRYVSTDPVDSEEEEFRGTQLAGVASRTDRAAKRKPERRLVKAIEVNSDTELESEVEVISEDKQTPVRKGGVSDSDEDLVTPLRRRRRFMPGQTTPPPTETRRSSQLHEARTEARELDRKLIKVTKHREGNKQKSAFRSNLERLRRKKAGLPSESEEDDSEDAESEPDIVENSRDWIVEDDGDGADIFHELPSEFQQPRQPLEQFKIAVQWEILDLLMPQGGFEPDAYFKPAIMWLRDRTINKSQAAISSIWRRPFVRALQRGPDINAAETGNLGFYCDACGRTNRIATYVCKFEGSRYDHLTLEDLDSDADSSEDDLDVDENAASDEEEEKARKERILRAEWNLGVNCYERTCVAHELFHLRKHLREEIFEKLRQMGLFTAAKKVERSVLPKGKRIEFANQVTEQLDNARFQQRLWSRYKVTIEKNEQYIVDPNAGRRKGRPGLS